MPQWSAKDRRKYEHVKESARKRGAREARAKQIAGRTVNKARRERGRTPQRSTQGTGKPSTGLEERSREELYNRAKQLRIEGRSRMNKRELVQAIRKSS